MVLEMKSENILYLLINKMVKTIRPVLIYLINESLTMKTRKNRNVTLKISFFYTEYSSFKNWNYFDK
jgi:hypothetical protein